MSNTVLNRLLSADLRPTADLLTRIAHAHSTWVQRRKLANLSAAQLHDIGLTADQADQEASRPIWDAPSHWRH